MADALEARGVPQLQRSLDAAADQLEQLEEPGEAAGRLLEAEAARTAPRRTGRLARSHGHTVVAGQVTVTASARYAAAVHARTPWLARTLTAQTHRVVEIYDDELHIIANSVRGA